MGKGKASDPFLNVLLYGCLFITAFWCAAIAAPIMWSIETNNEKNWPLVECLVVKHQCCRVSCGKSGCSYQPRWRVQFNRTDPGYDGVSWVGSYYGNPDKWFKPRENAEDEMYIYPVGTRFQCQYDPEFQDQYRYVLLPGQFRVEPYLIWTIVMYAIAGPVCVLPAIGYGIYKLAQCCCSVGAPCGKNRRAQRYNTYSANNISAPTPYTPTRGDTEMVVKPTTTNYDPMETPAYVEAPVLVPLAGVESPDNEPVSSGSSSEEPRRVDVNNMPVY